MSKTRNLSLLAGAAVTLVALTGSAYAVEGQAYTSADEVRAIVANMMADADTRSSMMMQGGGGGYDDGFYLADSSGNFRLNFRGLIQFRYFLNFRDEGDNDDSSDFESGFQNARTRIGLDGYVINPNLFYNVELITSDSNAHGYGGGGFTLQRAYVGYRWDNGFHLRWGQYRLQFLREDNVLPEYQLAADRSLMNETFRQGDVQGLELGYANEDFRVFASFNDGFNSANTDIGTNPGFFGTYDPITGDLVSAFPTVGALAGGENDIGLTARAEIRFSGTWEQFEDFTSMPGSEFGIMFGAAGHFQWTDADRTANAGDMQYFSWTADVSIEGDGWNVFIAGVGGYTDFDDVTTNNLTPTTGTFDPQDYGMVIQGGIFIPETDWEFFARYDVTFADSDRELADDTFSTVTFGTNWYWSGHAAKFTLDCQWFIDSVSPGGTNTLIGYFLTSEDNQFTIRFQFQLMF
jgi:hypothetical protein